MFENNIYIALLLSLIAGMSTCIGGLVVFFSNIKNIRFLAFSMSFAAGVMIYVSFMEMLPDAQITLSDSFGFSFGNSLTIGLFFLGMFLVYLIGKFIPSTHHLDDNINKSEPGTVNKGLYRTGTLVALAIAIHNFPEGIATFLASVNDLSVGLMIAFAIALHNIPEGVAVATPIYFSTGNKWKAFRYTFYSGIAEPIGAVIAFLIIGEMLSPEVLAYSLSIISGIMVYISFDYLLPTGLKYGKKRDVINGVVIGMAVMAISILISS